MKELRQLDLKKRSSLNEEEIINQIASFKLGQNLQSFNPGNFNRDVVNFYLGDAQELKKKQEIYNKSPSSKNTISFLVHITYSKKLFRFVLSDIFSKI